MEQVSIEEGDPFVTGVPETGYWELLTIWEEELWMPGLEIHTE